MQSIHRYYNNGLPRYAANWAGSPRPSDTTHSEVGDYIATDGVADVITQQVRIGIAAGAAYHAYGRTGSFLSAGLYFLGASLAPVLVGAVVGYQVYKDGFAKRKAG